MSGFELFDGDTKMKITLGSRTVMTTDGTLINLLPPSQDVNITFSVSFPDFSKDYVYNWQHFFSYGGGNVAYNSACAVAVTIPAQEWAQETNILAAPSGADIFVGRLSAIRTVAPTHGWNGEDLTPLQPMGVVIPFISGSLLMEAKLGMARAMSIYVAGGQLKLHRQQSVSTPPGGWGLYGDQYNAISPNSGSGGENVNGGAQGLPVLQTATKTLTSYTRSGGIGAPSYDERARRTASVSGHDPCPLPNLSVYSYATAYSVTLTGAFGRRS